MVDHIIFFPLCYSLLLAIYYPFPSFLYYPFRKVLLCIQYPCKQQWVFLFRYPKDLFRPLSITLQFLVSTAMKCLGKDTVEHQNHEKRANKRTVWKSQSYTHWVNDVKYFFEFFSPFCLFSSARRFISLMCFLDVNLPIHPSASCKYWIERRMKGGYFYDNNMYTYHPCMAYLPTFTWNNQPNVGKYIMTMDRMGYLSGTIKITSTGDEILGILRAARSDDRCRRGSWEIENILLASLIRR